MFERDTPDMKNDKLENAQTETDEKIQFKAETEAEAEQEYVPSRFNRYMNRVADFVSKMYRVGIVIW